MFRALIRSIELIGSLSLLIILSPLIFILAIIGFFETKSPFFIQKRVGKNRKIFSLIKFRTMKKNTSDLATHLIAKSAITRTGHFLRKSKLDELPQLINVLIGSMSLVGPRPCLPSQSELIEERDKRDIFTIRPGITGIAQINNVDMSTPKKLALYDETLVRNMSLKLYFYCLFATAFGKGQGDTIK